MYFEHFVLCPHCEAENDIDIEFYQDGGDIYSDICADMPNFIKCEGCQKVFKVGINIAIDVTTNAELTEEELKEYEEELAEENDEDEDEDK